MSSPSSPPDPDLNHVGPDEDPDRYVLLEYFESGSEGEIWQACTAAEAENQDEVPPRMLAVKLLAPKKSLEEVVDLGARWMRSVEVLKRKRIPGLAYLHDGFQGDARHRRGEGSDRRTWCLVMDWVHGQSFATFLESHPGDVRPLADVAVGLDAIHQSGYAHGDVKPANVKIWLEQNRRPSGTLVDLSLLPRITGEPPTAFIGTPGYMDPLVGKQGYSELSDLYSFAATLFHGLFDEPPRAGSEASYAKLLDRVPGKAGERIAGALYVADAEERAQRAGYAVGHLADWFGEIIVGLPVSQAYKEEIATTLRQKLVAEESPRQLSTFHGFLEDLYEQILDRTNYALLRIGAVAAGGIVGIALHGCVRSIGGS